MGYWAKDGSYVYEEGDIISKPEPELRPTGGPNFDERVSTSEAQVRLARERDKDKLDMLDSVKKDFPKTAEDLKFTLSAMDYRLDLIKTLVEHYRDQFLSVASQYKSNYSPEASSIINAKLTEYLCLIETLKTAGYTFGSDNSGYNKNSFYDPYKPDMQLDEIMTIMHVRRKNEADVSITFPVNYDLTDQENQNKGDAVTIVYTVIEHLNNNQYMGILWEKAGYSKEAQGSKVL